MNTPPPALNISTDAWQVVSCILRQHIPQHTVLAFGSRTRNTARPFSDLDLVIMTEQALGLSRMAALHEAFSESDLPWKVDLLDWSALNDGFKAIIAEQNLVIQDGDTAHQYGLNTEHQ